MNNPAPALELLYREQASEIPTVRELTELLMDVYGLTKEQAQKAIESGELPE